MKAIKMRASFEQNITDPSRQKHAEDDVPALIVNWLCENKEIMDAWRKLANCDVRNVQEIYYLSSDSYMFSTHLTTNVSLWSKQTSKATARSFPPVEIFRILDHNCGYTDIGESAERERNTGRDVAHY